MPPKLTWVEIPKKVGYEALWDEAYDRIRDKEYEQWIRSARFPEELVPEYEPYWFWQRVYPLIYQVRRNIFFSPPVFTLWNGYKIRTHSIHIWSKRNKKFIDVQRPMWLQKSLHFVSKHLARCWGIGHFLEAIAIGDQWGWDCPHCGYTSGALEDYHWSPWFRFTAGGSRFTGEYTQHWFEGFFNCPRCLRRWEYEDSD